MLGSSRWVSVFLLCSLLSMVACSQHTATDRLDDYLQRLANGLNMKHKSNTPQSITPPSYQWGYTGKLKNTSTDDQATISILEFLSLYGCDLQIVIAERNSSLGKFAPPSQQLIQHLRFLNYAPACIEELKQENKSSLAKDLRQAFEDKQAQLPLLIWQALLNEQEAKAFWKPPITLGRYPEHVGIAPEIAIKRLNQLSQKWLNGQYLEGINELENLLADLRTGDGGALLASLNLLSLKLQEGNQLISAYISQEACLSQRPSIDIRILENIIAKFFVGEVQVWAAQLNRRYYSLIEAYQQLEQTFQDIEPELYQHWRTNRDQQLQSGINASAKHVASIEKALQHCQPKEQNAP